MNPNRLEKIRLLAERAAALDEQSVEGGISRHFIEIRRGGNGELMIRANREGLVHFASKCLSLATLPNEGSHLHFDETGLVNHCDVPLVVVLADAERDAG